MKKRHTPEQIIHKLRQAEVLLGQGKNHEEACRELGIWMRVFAEVWGDASEPGEKDCLCDNMPSRSILSCPLQTNHVTCMEYESN